MKKTLKRWRGAILKWSKLLWLNDHTIDMGVTEDGWPEKGDKFATAAVCETQPRYKSFVCEAREGYVKEANDDSLDETACHEVIHQVIAPLNEVAWEAINTLPASKRDGWHQYRRYMMEFTVSHLTNVVRKLHESPKGT